jgi:hypothetical protein
MLMVDLQLILEVLIHENQLFLPNAVLRIVCLISAQEEITGKMPFSEICQ